MVKKAVPAKKAPAAGATKAAVKKSAPAPSPKNPPKEAVSKATNSKPTPAKAAVKAAPAAKTETKTDTKAAPAAKPAAATKPPAKAAPAVVKAAPVKAEPKKADAEAAPATGYPPVKGETKDGIKYTKDFDAKFLTAQWKLLTETREQLTGQAVRLEDEANSLIAEDMGDVQFDEESGEGDTMVVERERDLFLSARVRQDIEEIDSALRRLSEGTYGYSVVSFRPIPRERLEAIPWATELTEEKVGGIGRR